MAITKIGGPDTFTPGYNPMYYYFDSDNKNITGFRYIVDLYRELAGSKVLIKRMRISPRPLDGYCAVEISKTIQAYLTHQLPHNSFQGAQNSYVGYSLEVGEEYSVNWEYDAFEQYAALGPFYNKVVLTTTPNVGGGSGDTHPFQVNDYVNVTPSLSTNYNSQMTGLFKVIANLNSTSIVISAEHVYYPAYPDGLLPGSVTFSDNRKTIYSNLLKVENVFAFNGRVPHTEFYTWTPPIASISTPSKFLSNIPTKFNITDKSTLLLNIYTGINGAANYLWFQNDIGTIQRVDITNDNLIVKALPVGAFNMPTGTLVSGTGNIIQDGISNYKMWTTSTSTITDVSSEVYTFYVTPICSKYDIIEIVFLDRLGSLGSFTFEYDSKIQTSIKRTEQKLLIGELDASYWTYETTEAAKQVINTDIETNYRVNTAWLTQSESDYFQELLSSPVAYMKIGTSTRFWPIVITSSSAERKNIISAKNIKYELKFKSSNEDIINY